MNLTRLKSTLSAVTSTLQVVRHERSKLERRASEWKRMFYDSKSQLDVERFVNNEQWGWAKERIEALQSIINETRELLSVLSSSLGYGLGGENEPLASMVDRVNEGVKHHLAVMTNMRDKAQLARDEVLAKLARYEAAETWHQVTAGEGELPPEGVAVLFRLPSRSPSSVVPFIGSPYPVHHTFEWRFLSSEDVPETAGNNGQAI